jgi:hypothetical protein
MGTRLEPAVAGILLFLLGLGLLSFGHREAAAVQTSVCWICWNREWEPGRWGYLCGMEYFGWATCSQSSPWVPCNLSGPGCNVS